MPKLKRAKTASQIYERKRDILPFEAPWLSHIGAPEISGSWFVYGHSGNGKTSYLLQMAKYLARFGRVWYNGLEEGDSESFKQALQRVGMEAVGSDFFLLEDSLEDLMARLRRRNRPRFLFIDSLQVMGMAKKGYHDLKDLCDHHGVQLIIIGHAEGKKPEGRLGKYIEYISFVKIWVEGFKAFPKSRYGGAQPYIIYEKRASEYWTDVT